jgi:hypothetical protein
MQSVRELPESMKLTRASNYLVWSFRVKQILMREKVWRFVDPIIHPVCVTDDTSIGSTSMAGGSAATPGDGTKEPETLDSKRKDKEIDTTGSATTITPAVANQEELRQTALIIINLSMSDRVIERIKNYSDPSLLWKRLKGLYDTDSSARRIMLKNQLYAMKMDDGKTMEENLSKINSIVDQLAGIGFHIPDKELVDLTINSLPRSWEIFSSVIAARDQLPSYPELENRILQEDMRRHIHDDNEEALVATFHRNTRSGFQRPFRGRGRSSFRGGRGRGYRGSGRNNFRSTVTPTHSTCHRCGQTGHWAREC